MTYDFIVLGIGGIGSAALYSLTKRGARVLGIEQYKLAHNQGSSHGDTRMIRQAYFEHPSYVPLLRRAYDLWVDIEQTSGRTLVQKCGVLSNGPKNSEIMRGIRTSAAEHKLEIEHIRPHERQARFPGFRFEGLDMRGQDVESILEHNAGYLMVEQSVRAFAASACGLGAELLENTPVLKWHSDDRSVSVTTPAGEFKAGALVVTAGAWSDRLLGPYLAQMGARLTILRKHMHWFAHQESSNLLTSDNNTPGFLFDVNDGLVYGFPAIDQSGIKLGNHAGGQEISNPATLDTSEDLDDSAFIESFVQQHLPSATTRRTKHVTCMYTMSPDGHFIVDHHPEHGNVAFAAGLSGHGYKFAPVLGEVLADLVADGTTSQPTEFLRLGRFNK